MTHNTIRSQIDSTPEFFFQKGYHNLVYHLDCDCREIPLPISDTELEIYPFLDDDIYHLPDGLRTISIEKYDKRYHAAFVSSTNHGVIVLNDSALAILKAFEGGKAVQRVLIEGATISGKDSLIRQLRQQGFLVRADETTIRPPASSSNMLSAWLHVSNACNLACQYCYINKSPQTMSTQVGYAVIDAIMRASRQHDYQAVVLKYAGGEPTLMMDRIETIHRYAQRQLPTNVQLLRGTVLSNGVGLSAQKIARMRDLGLNLTISLDGLGILNDQQRPLVNGAPSSSHILEGIHNAMMGGMTPAISITVTPDSSNGLLELMEWILAYKLPFNIHFYRLHKQGLLIEEQQAQEDRIIENMRKVLALVEQNQPSFSVLNGFIDYADLSHARTTSCSAGQNYLVFDHRGRLSSCQMLIDQPIGDFRSQDPVNLIRTSDIAIRNLPVDSRESCSTCDWRYWCGGGCPVQTYRAEGRVDTRSPYCRIYKTLFPEIIRLEAIRLIQQQRDIGD